MSRILKVSSGDYRLQVQPHGNIILDTQSTDGTVTIIGDLDVQGNFTYVESTSTQIKDNIIQLNYGQTGNGIGSGFGYVSGIEVERGNYSAAQILFNETVNHYDAQTATTVAGTWTLKQADGKVQALQLRTITNDGLANIGFDLQSSNYTLRVYNAPNYITTATNNNDLVTYGLMATYVASTYTPGSGTQGQAITDRVLYPVSNSTTPVSYTHLRAHET